uniref:Uncharacterized protein n=1 Tax=Oryza glumipatula TaxID=40148 RepID=A0A0E0ATL3_9ORYZ
MDSSKTGKGPTEILPNIDMPGQVGNSKITYQQIDLITNICQSEHKKPKKEDVIQITPQDGSMQFLHPIMKVTLWTLDAKLRGVLKPSKVSHRIESESLCIVAPGTTLTNRKELLGALCKYVMSIDCAESLQKEWIRSMKPYPISLSLRNLQDILDGPHETLHYVHKIANIAVNVKLAMEGANPTWNDGIYLWNRKIPRDVPKTENWEVTGFHVLNFIWDGYIYMQGLAK